MAGLEADDEAAGQEMWSDHEDRQADDEEAERPPRRQLEAGAVHRRDDTPGRDRHVDGGRDPEDAWRHEEGQDADPSDRQDGPDQRSDDRRGGKQENECVAAAAHEQVAGAGHDGSEQAGDPEAHGLTVRAARKPSQAPAGPARGTDVSFRRCPSSCGAAVPAPGRGPG
jgi:hypothetical protein